MININNELIQDYLSKIEESTYQGVYDKYRDYSLNPSPENYDETFDTIYCVSSENLKSLLDDWQENKDVPSFKFLSIDNGAYVVADNRDGEFFVEAYNCIEKAILFLNTQISPSDLYNNDLETCISILKDCELEDELKEALDMSMGM